MGMFSITRSEEPRPELRVTLRSCTPGSPHEAQSISDKVDCDDEEIAERAELDDCLGLESADCGAADHELALVRLAIVLAFDDFACEKVFSRSRIVRLSSSSSSTAWMGTT